MLASALVYISLVLRFRDSGAWSRNDCSTYHIVQKIEEIEVMDEPNWLAEQENSQVVEEVDVVPVTSLEHEEDGRYSLKDVDLN